MTRDRESNGTQKAAPPVGPISSGPFEISPTSFGPSAAPDSLAARHQAPAPAGTPPPLTTIVAIGGGVFVVLVGLALLFFR